MSNLPQIDTRWRKTQQPDDVTARLLALLFGDRPKGRRTTHALHTLGGAA